MSNNNEASVSIDSEIPTKQVEVNVSKNVYECQPDTNLTKNCQNIIPAVHDVRNIGISTTSRTFLRNDKYLSSTSRGTNLKENNVKASSKTSEISFEIQPETKSLDSILNSASNISIKMADKDASYKDVSLYQNESNTNLNTAFCRICMASGGGSLISPCRCKGTLGSVHSICLQRWLSASGRTTCELCAGPYPVEIAQRYSFQRALVIWLGHFRLTFQTDCIFFCLVSIITIGIVVCCLMGFQYMVEQGIQLRVPQSFTEIVLNLMLAVVICGYIAFTYTLWNNHFTVWKRWRNATVEIRLIMVDEPNSSSKRNYI